MDTHLLVGGGVVHNRYGRGKVLGLSERKGAVRVRFGKLGVKEVEYPSNELKPAVNDESTKGRQCLKLSFDSATQKGTGCRWLIQYSKDSLSPLIRDINIWANAKAKLNGAKIELNSLDKKQMVLHIEGNGRDGRCRWCRTFRSGLRTAVRRRHGLRSFVLEGSCSLDQK